MSEGRRIIWLILIMLAAVTVSTAVAVTVLYRTAFEQERLHLLQNVDDQAHLMEAVAWVDQAHHPGAGDALRADALAQIERAFEHYPSDDQIAEITVATGDGEVLRYLVTHGRVLRNEIPPIPLGSPLAEPMQRALAGHSGAMIGRDYRGVTVLAAYQPVPALAAGVVAKMDLAAIRAPFIRGAVMVIGLALVLIVIGAALLVRLTKPIVRHLAEAGSNLAQREAELALILASTGEGIFGMDADGACTFINRAALTMLGYAHERELLGQDMHARIHHSCRDGTPLASADCPIQQTRRRDNALRLDDEILWRANGSCFPAELRSHPMLRDGQVVGTVVTFDDISERKEREMQHLHAQRLEVLGQLTGGITHDFNNLLTIILVNLRLLAGSGRLRADADLLELVDDALSAAEDGAEVIERLLTFSRRQQAEPRLVDLRTLLADCRPFLRRVTDEHIELRLCPGPGPLPLWVDPQQLQNALLNLAINARDAMPRGGTLTVETGRREIAPGGDPAHPTLAPGAYVTVTVADTGTGMSPEAVARAVEPFYTTKAAGKGSGLGLSMVYRFARQAGGGLRIDSAPGAGTGVSILLPEAAAAATGPAASAAAAAAALPRRAAAAMAYSPCQSSFTKLYKGVTGR